jgi:hypothetical protein
MVDNKVLESKIAFIIAWFIPLAILMFGLYRFAVKPNIWMFIVSCIASMVLGGLLESYLGL